MREQQSFQVGEAIDDYRLLQKPGHEAEQVVVPQGQGGTAVVYLVEQKLAQQTIKRALKLFSPTEEVRSKRDKLGASYGEKTFLQEIDAISTITHQNIVKIVDAGDINGQPYFVMEYIDGPPLDKVIANPFDEWATQAKRDPFLIVRIAQQTCWALVYLHSHNRYHFDLAPKNLFLRRVDRSETPRPHVVVGDLGVSQSIPPLGDIPKDGDQMVMINGTKGYTPQILEQYRGKRPVPLRLLAEYAAHWDLFALGKIIDDLIDAWGLRQERKLRALIHVSRKLTTEPTLTAEAASALLDRLLPTHVTTAGVEELSGDAVGGRTYIAIPLYAAPASERVRDVLDHPALTRLQLVPQLLLYRSTTPGGVHTLYEHVIGSYALLLRALAKLLSEPLFRVLFWKKEIEEAQLAALLSRVGSFPFDRIVNGMSPVTAEEKRQDLWLSLRRKIDGYPSLEETIVSRFPSADLNAVVEVLSPTRELEQYQKVISSLMRSSLDVRGMDYLVRDSHHTGIPAGAGVDVGHIIDNLTWDEGYEGVAITRPGVFSVEHLLCARYWMFARLYWNQFNRGTTAMLNHVMHGILLDPTANVAYVRRSLSEVDERGALLSLHNLWKMTQGYGDADATILELLQQARPRPYKMLLELFARNWVGNEPGSDRAVVNDAPHDWQRLGPRELETLRQKYYKRSALTAHFRPSQVLFDVPVEKPLKLGEDTVVKVSADEKASLTDLSNIVRTLPEAFYDTVVRLRVFCHPDLDNSPMRDAIREEVREFLCGEFKREYKPTG